jgi:hypothetical protein
MGQACWNYAAHQHGMSYSLRASSEASYMPRWPEWFIGDLTTVECLYTVTGRVAEGNHLSSATLVRHGGGFPPHRDARFFQPRRQCRRVRDLPAEKTLSIRQPTVDDQALLSVVHAEGTHAAAAINRLQPKLADS